MRETVCQKHCDDDDAEVCCCFRHSPGNIRGEIIPIGQSMVVEQIEAGMRAGQCACDIRNPHGSCCLGDVRRLVDQIKKELNGLLPSFWWGLPNRAPTRLASLPFRFGPCDASRRMEYRMRRENSEVNSIVSLVIRAFSRARVPILTVALAYFISVVIGIVMVHTGNAFALAHRGNIVAAAQSSPILVALDQNNRWRAALLDFAGNLFGALANTVAGLGVVVAYPIVVYRGWIGGIVSIESAHISRLADSKEAAYYLITLVLQLIPYSTSGGAGVNMGLAYLRPKSEYQGDKWLGIPKKAIHDVLRIYLIVVPLFLLASMWEFFAR